MLALVFFLRAALDPGDDLYYFTPFMLTIMAYEDAQGFPIPHMGLRDPVGCRRPANRRSGGLG